MHRSLLRHAQKTAMTLMLVAPLILGFSQTLPPMFLTPVTTTVNAGVSAGQAA